MISISSLLEAVLTEAKIVFKGTQYDTVIKKAPPKIKHHFTT